MKLFIRTLFLILFFVVFSTAYSQDLTYARKIINILASPEFHGRGYVNKGDSIAADFIYSEMSFLGLKNFNNTFYQHFELSVNTLPGNLMLKFDDKTLKPVDDFIVYNPSSKVKGTFPVTVVDMNTKTAKLDKLIKKGLHNRVIIIDVRHKPEKKIDIFDTAKFYNIFNAQAVIFLVDKNPPLSWSVYTGHLLIDFCSLEVQAKEMKKYPKKVELDIENEFIKKYRTQNVIGYVEGSKYPDSFFVFTAHYDHLGRMGSNTYFPGAHDNASGTAMMLDLAAYYTENIPEYSIAFIATAAEEAGLLGSRHFCEKPLFPLDNIKFLFNLDMVSTGEEGMMVVNGQVFKDEFATLVKINDENKYLIDIKSRPEAANSDHHPFYLKGVKSFYFYTLGGYSQYHNTYDIYETLPMTDYNDMFRLIVRFVEQLSKNNDG